MNLRDLNYLVAVADFRNFTQAANYCAIGQPTLSTQIKKLEDYLGVTIFNREKNNVTVTEYGESIVQIARVIVSQVALIRKIAKESQSPFSGKLAIGAFPSLASYVLPEYVFKIKQNYPELNLHVIEEKTDSLVALLSSMKLDAALIALPIQNSDLEYGILFEDPFKLAVNRDHPLSIQNNVDINCIDSENLLLLDEGHCLRGQALKLCNSPKLLGDDFRASSLETLRFMVKNGSGVTLMPSVAVQKNENDICYLDIRQEPGRTIALVWHKNSPKKLLFKELCQLLNYRPIT
jgi:LysR family hydrogen peroxide-inducible transcriptional activator